MRECNLVCFYADLEKSKNLGERLLEPVYGFTPTCISQLTDNNERSKFIRRLRSFYEDILRIETLSQISLSVIQDRPEYVHIAIGVSFSLFCGLKTLQCSIRYLVYLPTYLVTDFSDTIRLRSRIDRIK